METYSTDPDEKQLSLITQIQIESADKSDANALLPAVQNTAERTMSPKELLADSLYGSDDNVQKAKQDCDVDVAAPVMEAKNKGISLGNFDLGSNGKIVRCPQVRSPMSFERPKDKFIEKYL